VTRGNGCYLFREAGKVLKGAPHNTPSATYTPITGIPKGGSPPLAGSGAEPQKAPAKVLDGKRQVFYTKVMATYDYPIIVIGAGAGGLVVAIGAARAGKKVLLIEDGNWGGDCTNSGCIPSKSLIAAAHAAHAITHAGDYRLSVSDPTFNGDGALARTRQIIDHFRSHEDPSALAKENVDTLAGFASFEDRHTVNVSLEDGSIKHVSGKDIVIATGSRPMILPIDGLKDVPYLTNENVFNLDTIPKKLAVIGGGAIGSELTQAFARLGSQVSLIEFFPHLMFREEPETATIIEKAFIKEGVDLYLNHQTLAVKNEGDEISLTVENRKTKKQKKLTVSYLLIAVGRKANIDKLNLEAVGVQADGKKILIDKYGRSSQKNIWALGDVAGRAAFTHTAEDEGRTVLTNLLIPLPWPIKKHSKQAIPRVTYTDPEVASVGLTEDAAKEAYGENKIATYTVPFTDVDRAQTTGKTEGMIKVITKKWSSTIIGATIIAPRAGEMLMEITTAMYGKIPLRKLASLIHPYPVYSRAIRKAADQWLTKTILPALKKLFRR